MSAVIQLIHRGGVASAQGFTAGGVHAGIKTAGDGVFDLGIVLSDSPASAAGVFSQNKVLSPSVTLSSRRIANGTARAIVANSGCANCSVGQQGLTDAEEMTALAAAHVDVDPEEVLIGSTGLIGVELPMALVRQNLGNIILSDDGGNRFARSIMTTDTHPKEVAVSAQIDGREIVIGGCAKGSGMIHPNMATMLSFITTDAAVEPSFLQQALKNAADASFNMIDVDGDQSTNDTLVVLANGRAGGSEIRGDTPAGEDFQEALTYVCVELAKEMARDGEGATHLVEVTVEGADTLRDARRAARKIVSSLLVKAMIYGRDPNWGRVMMALGNSGIEFEESDVDVFINDIHIVHEGMSIAYLKDAVVSSMSEEEVKIRVSVGSGEGAASAWGCDLTEGYVIENSAYST